jgi:lysophospholipase L1-like esterase
MRGPFAFLCVLGVAACAGAGGSTTDSAGTDPGGAGATAGGGDNAGANATADASANADASASGSGNGNANADGGGAANDSGAPPPSTAAECFKSIIGKVPGPDYDQFHPVIDPSCAGTHHQTITGVQKIVTLGDSVTEGTPPNLPTQFYRTLVEEQATKTFGAIETADCAKWGARMIDLMDPTGYQEVQKCFPNAVEPKHTLVIMTMGGNDIAGWAKNQLDTATATAQADVVAGQLRAVMHWFKDDKTRFPNGIDVVFTNVYEYTDTSGDLLSCPAASTAGFKANWPQGAPAIVHLQEQMMQVAVETQTDMVFLLEHFCGHGYKRADPTLQCYRGPNAELWFDLTCIHPTPTGHQQIANLFQTVIHD